MELKEQKLNEIRNQLETLFTSISVHSSKGTHLHEVERDLFKHLLQLGLQILQYYLFLVHEIVSHDSPVDSLGYPLRHTGKQTRPYVSVFGLLRLTRTKYYSATDKTSYPLDTRLGLPRGRYSYLLSDWLSYGAVELDFRQSAQQLERILGHHFSGMQSSRESYHLSEQVDDFYQQQPVASVDGSHLSVGYDGKGIPIIRSETERAAESTVSRLGKGKKKNVKREATISVSSSFTPQPRSKEELLNSLFYPYSNTGTANLAKPSNKHQWHEHKHIRAFLMAKTKAITYGLDNLLSRDPTGKKPIIVLIDGDRALEKAVKQICQEKQIAHRVDAYVLDFIHLLEYVWKVANAYLGEQHPQRTAWVYQQAALLLDSQYEKVLADWKQIRESQTLSKNRLYNLDRAITYVSNRPHMLDYKSYLKKGYPITTGAVESACGHFIKSRMDRNAMHWGKKGAQKMLDIRAVKKNENWEQYIQYFIEKEQAELYRLAA